VNTQLILPEHVERPAADQLVAVIAEVLVYAGRVPITEAYDLCNLQPTTRAAILAAQAAVAVLIAHEIGQGVGDGAEH